MSQGHQFPNSIRTYKDTFKRGQISVRGFNLVTDEGGFIEAPADLAKDIEPHGFIPMARPVTPERQQGRR